MLAKVEYNRNVTNESLFKGYNLKLRKSFTYKDDH